MESLRVVDVGSGEDVTDSYIISRKRAVDAVHMAPEFKHFVLQREKNHITKETEDLYIYYSPYSVTDVVRFKATGAISTGLPLKRHIRQLVELFGYDAVKRAIDDMPSKFRQEAMPHD